MLSVVMLNIVKIKASSLIRKFVIYGQKKFFDIVPTGRNLRQYEQGKSLIFRVALHFSLS